MLHYAKHFYMIPEWHRAVICDDSNGVFFFTEIDSYEMGCHPLYTPPPLLRGTSIEQHYPTSFIFLPYFRNEDKNSCETNIPNKQQ